MDSAANADLVGLRPISMALHALLSTVIARIYIKDMDRQRRRGATGPFFLLADFREGFLFIVLQPSTSFRFLMEKPRSGENLGFFARASCFEDGLVGRTESDLAHALILLLSPRWKPLGAPHSAAARRLCSAAQLQPWPGPPASPSQNFCKGAPPEAPVAGIVIVCSTSTPLFTTKPLGTINEG